MAGPTVLNKLDQQADLVIEELHKLPNRDSNGQVQVYLVGNSQAALLLSWIDMKLQETKNRNIKLLAMISVNGPHKGSNLFNATEKTINEFFHRNEDNVRPLQ